MNKKQISIALLVIVSFFSCGDDLTFNNPAVQGNKDSELWRAISYAADIDFGGFLIEGGNGVETVQLVTLDDRAGVYPLGNGTMSRALFRDQQGVLYSTEFVADPSLSLYPATGEIIVESVSNTDPKTVTGTYWFQAYSEDGTKTVSFNEGVFYQVPLIGGLLAMDLEN